MKNDQFYGATLDFLGHVLPRFPTWMQNAKISFCTEPEPCYHVSFTMTCLESVKVFVNVFIRIDSAYWFESLFVANHKYERMIRCCTLVDYELNEMYGTAATLANTLNKRVGFYFTFIEWIRVVN